MYFYENGDKSFYCTDAQAEVLETLKTLNKGGIGTVYGYRPTTGYLEPPTIDIQIITRFSTASLYQRKQEAIRAIEFGDVIDGIIADERLKKLPIAECERIFNERKKMLLDSMQQTLDGDRSDGHRQGHDRCYATTADGIKVNFDCEKGRDGLMHPKLHNGYPVAESILIHYLELNREYRTEGKRKTVNSGEPVRMGNCIEKLLNQRSVGLRTLSLKPGNFERMKLSRTTIKNSDLSDLTEPLKNEFSALLEDLGIE